MGKEIKLTQGLFATIDDEDYDLVSQYLWRVLRTGNQIYAITNCKTIDGKLSTIRMHRLVMGNPKGKIIDHKHGNGLNNCKDNLRFCDKIKNAQNRTCLCKLNKSGVHGVSYYKRDKNWEARITVKNKLLFLGRFENINDAQEARIIAERKHFGEFAPRLNNGT